MLVRVQVLLMLLLHPFTIFAKSFFVRRALQVEESNAALSLLDNNVDGNVAGKELRKRDEEARGDDDDVDDTDDDDDDDDAVANGNGVEPVLRLKMERGAGGFLDVGCNLLKDDADVKAVLGRASHLNVAAMHRFLTLQKM
jgi:hypothetical protein